MNRDIKVRLGQGPSRSAAGAVRLDDDAIARILRATGAKVTCSASDAAAILQFVFNSRLLAAFGRRISAKELRALRRQFIRTVRTRDPALVAQHTASLRAELNRFADLDFPPPAPEPLDFGRLRRWVVLEKQGFRERPGAASGGRPKSWWHDTTFVSLCAAYEAIYKPRKAASTLGGPTARFIRAFMLESRSALRNFKEAPHNEANHRRHDPAPAAHLTRSQALDQFTPLSHPSLREHLRQLSLGADQRRKRGIKHPVEAARRFLEMTCKTAVQTD